MQALVMCFAVANHRVGCCTLQVAMKACPYRADFYAKLAADPAGGAAVPADKLNEDLNKWLTALAAIVSRMEAFYEQGGHNKGF